MRSTGFTVLLFLLFGTASCGEESVPAGGGWVDDVMGQLGEHAVAPAESRPLPAAPSLDAEELVRYAAVGHALIPVKRNLLETLGPPAGQTMTRLGLLRVSGTEVGLDLVDWRRKDALDLLRIRGDLAGVIHLDPKQICDEFLRTGILEATSGELSLSFASGTRIPRRIPACLAALQAPALHLLVPAADSELVADLASLPGLTTLILRAPELDAAAMSALGRASELRTLELGAAQVDGDVLRELSRLEHLESLSLFGTQADDRSLDRLPNSLGLRVLDLGFTGVGDAGMARLAELRELRSLGLWHTGVTDEGLKAVASLEHLVTLDLAGTTISDRGVSTLLALSGLRSLDLTGTRISDVAMGALAGLPGLERLRIGATGVSDGGLLSIAAFPRLRILDLRGCPISQGAVEALRRVRPEMDIRFTR